MHLVNKDEDEEERRRKRKGRIWRERREDCRERKEQLPKTSLSDLSAFIQHRKIKSNGDREVFFVGAAQHSARKMY